jgi:probable DNA metabolism protein
MSIVSDNVAVSVNGFAEWRVVARKLLSERIPPHAVNWRSSDSVADLFEADHLPVEGADESIQRDDSASSLLISRDLLHMLETAACYRTEDRWSFLYGMLWRWQNGDRTVVSVADADGQRLHAMIKTVDREAHKMNAFLRFRERAPELGAPRFVAWFEPAHDVLPRVAQHFARRMGANSWLIATPQSTWVWDGKTLLEGPPSANGPLEVDDEGERLWLAYYRSIFNPARLNTDAMEMHMPVRYWKNLPEGKLIPGLISHASAGAQRNGQALEVASRRGTKVQVDAVDAQPERPDLTPLDQCKRCDLWRHATQAVAGEGPRKAKIMLVGEQPGDQEDIAGKPFVGPAGQLLDRALQAAGLDRDSVYVTNAVKHFKWEPRGKRRLHKTPAQLEMNACMLWLEQEMEQVKPAVIVALGSTALKALTQTSKISLTNVIGQTLTVNGQQIIATYHPSYALRVPDQASKTAAFDAMVAAFKQARLYA